MEMLHAFYRKSIFNYFYGVRYKIGWRNWPKKLARQTPFTPYPPVLIQLPQVYLFQNRLVILEPLYMRKFKQILDLRDLSQFQSGF